MNLLLFLKREVKEWIEFFIRNIPGTAGYLIRGFYLQNRVNKSFRNNRFEAGLRIENPKNIVFGNNSYYGFNCKIYADQLSRVKVGSNVTFNSNVMVNARGKGSINIGDNVLIGPNVVLRSCNHSFANLDEPIIKQGMIEGEIVIEDNVWIGSNCVILPKCKIGEGSIVAAGAVVTSDVESFTIVGGVPAKFIKRRV
tara:strand:- start:4280 stop:4870 length:591 start_codon:yes stop_codon:yes gene_type:complete